MTETNSTTTSPEKPKKEGFLSNIAFNVIIPTLILTKLSGDDWLGPTWALIVALAFPLGYGLRDLLRLGKVNFFSALGFIGILLTGGISLLKLDPQYIAIKEAAIPGLLGVATALSVYTRWPLVKTLLYNDQILNTTKIAESLQANGNQPAFDRTLRQTSWIVAGSFFFSSALNYILAKMIVTSPPGTEAYNTELGEMTAYGYLVIAIPSTLILMGALFFLFSRIGKLTGLKLEEVMVAQ
ncbi:VC0807 family protein [Microbulbifer sp. EKSA008]|uniref:VC0807 family protein n=1 Tax=unclassified Microbulbifer TaxID=2619833 RepID=UPI0024ADAE3D|nr:VC0807 family protein [Microbulbifer sp. VAAF005]WHI48093.1 MFS transporter [Microbulbifer sp. VAAF005]WNZ55168.1 VC0807 family protein [Microbulbifer sp. MKSA007]